MTSFKKVKKLTRDWQVVRHALRMAPQLEVSPEGYRVKRRDNLPETLRKPRMLTSVVAIRVPEEYGSVDQITSMFRPYGIIALVRLLRKGKDVSTLIPFFWVKLSTMFRYMWCPTKRVQGATLLVIESSTRVYPLCGVNNLLNTQTRHALPVPRFSTVQGKRKLPSCI